MLPSLERQKAIGLTLAMLDRRMHILRGEHNLLEQLADIVFKQSLTTE